MKYAIGGWFPRTKIHLQEFYNFLNGDNLGFGKTAAEKSRSCLKIKSALYYKRNIDYIKAISENLFFIYTEDGLFFVAGENKKKIKDYYMNYLLPTFAFIYSRGAPIPKLVAELYEKDPDPIIRSIDPNIKVTKEAQKTLPSFHLFEYVVFFEEYKQFFEIALRAHRSLWSAISKIRDKEKIRFKDLPTIRDTLLDIQRDITFIKSRLNQLDGFMKTRETLVPEDILEQLKTVKAYNFETLRNAKEYFKELFEMTEKHANTTLSLVSSLYQENEQNELTNLQVIFIIGVIASIISLGAMPNSSFILKDLAGNIMYTGQTSHFDYKALIIYGSITLALGGVVFYLMHFIFKSARRFKLGNITLGIPDMIDKGLKDIKKIVK